MLLSITAIGPPFGRGVINTEQLATPPPDFAGSFDLAVVGLNGREPDLSVSITDLPVLAFHRFALGSRGGAHLRFRWAEGTWPRWNAYFR